MRKRILSLLCVLALCLGLLPVTALAEGTAPQTLYVGSTTISAGYWTSSDGGTTWARQENQPEGNNYIYYDGQGTLKLHNATIQGGTNTGSAPYGAGIYALSSSGQPVALTIELIGTNTITGTFGIFLNAEIDASSYGTNATLTITSENNGSLQVSGLNYGIYVKSGTGNASLTINDASVVAKTTQTYSSFAGVYVQSSAHATSSPQLSLAVNGGSLTTSASEGNDGIQFYVGSSEATGATTRLTVSENAIVRAENGINAYRVDKPTPSGTGIVFNDKKGTVYDDVTLDESLTIAQGETLTIPEGSTLTVPEGKILTNNGTIDNSGTLTNNGTVTNNGTLNVNEGGKLEGETTGGSGTVVNTPTITAQPESQSVTEGNTATFTVAATGENLSYQWQQSTDNGQSWTNISGAISSTYTTDAATLAMNNYQYQCVVSNSAGSVTSSAATLTVQAKPAPVSVTGVSLDKATLELYTGDTATLTATVQPSNATNQNVTWQSDNANVATVEGGTVTAVGAGETDITVTTEDGGKTATCHVTVTQSAYSISADTTALNFGSVYTGYAQPAAKEVTITNTGNRPLTLNQPASTSSFEVGTLTVTELAAGEKATFTVQPKAGLAVGTYSENITVSGTGGATVTIPASFTVEQHDNTPYYGITVNAPANGTVTCYAKSAAKGAEVTLTVKPDVGYALDKLTVTDASGKTVDVTKVDEKTYTFVMPGRAVTVEAVFAPSTSGLPFTDVSAGDWFYEAVQFVYENGLMDGVGNNLFAPNATLTRAMAVTILYRLEGSPDLDGENLGYPFADVDGNAWYGDAVYWARCNGIVDGVENNHFDPTGSLTREQMATVLYRYAQYKGADVSASGDISGFADSANVSDWAVDAVKWAVGSGLVNGVEGNALAPQGTSTRAQTAAILARFCGSVI